jgi:hypothetical protein
MNFLCNIVCWCDMYTVKGGNVHLGFNFAYQDHKITTITEEWDIS